MCFCKEKLLIIAGAGASVDFDMLSSSQIEEMFELNGPNKLRVGNRFVSLYKYVKDELLKYHQSGTSLGRPLPDKVDDVYFEEVVYQLLNLYSALSETHKNGLGAFCNLNVFPTKIMGNRNVKLDYFDFCHEADILVAKLLDEIREKCTSLPLDKLALLKQLLKKLNKSFDLSVVNLNYDNILYQSIPFKAETGFGRDGKFEPRRILYNQKWNFFYHLHGSVHFYYANTEHAYEIRFVNDFTQEKVVESNRSFRSLNDTTEGFPILSRPIIVGYGKAWQIQREPYLFYYNDLARRVDEADKILFIGYSFGDLHLNNLIQMSLRHKKKKKIVILDYAEQLDGFCCREDYWTYDVCRTLRIYPVDFDFCSASELTDLSPFERNRDKTVSISYKGFGFYLDKPNLLVSELRN
jgi:hypothetical protein